MSRETWPKICPKCGKSYYLVPGPGSDWWTDLKQTTGGKRICRCGEVIP